MIKTDNPEADYQRHLEEMEAREYYEDEILDNDQMTHSEIMEATKRMELKRKESWFDKMTFKIAEFFWHKLRL